MDVLISLTVAIISQCIRVSNHVLLHIIKYIQFLFVNFTSIKLEKLYRENTNNKKRGGKLVFEIMLQCTRTILYYHVSSAKAG